MASVILGIDPGTVIMGVAVVRLEGAQHTLLHMDAIRFDTKRSPFERLADIHAAIDDLLDRFSPDEMALEAPFFGKNIQSMLKLGRAQGVVMGAGLARGLAIHEYSPRRVKQSITGNGSSSKEKVAGMLQSIYRFTDMPRWLDATDGLAVATCHAFLLSRPAPIEARLPTGPTATNEWAEGMKKNSRSSAGKTSNAWTAFVKNNPEKLKP